jgi:hypothetical protein
MNDERQYIIERIFHQLESVAKTLDDLIAEYHDLKTVATERRPKKPLQVIDPLTGMPRP